MAIRFVHIFDADHDFRRIAEVQRIFRSYYGPMAKTYAALDPEKQAALTCDLLDLLERGNRSGDGTLVLPSEYLEVVLQKKD